MSEGKGNFLILLGIVILVASVVTCYLMNRNSGSILANQSAIASSIGKISSTVDATSHGVDTANTGINTVDQRIANLNATIAALPDEVRKSLSGFSAELRKISKMVKANKAALYSGNAAKRHKKTMAKLSEMESRVASVEAVQAAAREGAETGVRPAVKAAQAAESAANGAKTAAQQTEGTVVRLYDEHAWGSDRPSSEVLAPSGN